MAKAARTSTICKTHPHVPLFAFFCFLVSLHEELRARVENEALVDRIAAEKDDDWREIEALHKAQRRNSRASRPR
jgi:hypothetical protein